MKIKEKNDELEITTTVYQSRMGGIYVNWGNEAMLLDKKYADYIARDVPNFNEEDYNNFYK